MESIKDMNLFDFDDHFKKEKEKSIQQLMKDENVLTVLSKYHKNQTFVEDNWAKFLDYQEDLKICKICPGLNKCPKSVAGRVQKMTIEDDQVMISSKPCLYGNELLERQKILSHVLISNVSEKLIFVELNQLKDCDNDIVEMVYDYILNPKDQGLYIQGGYEKSLLAGFLIRNLANKGKTCGYIHFPTFLLDLKNSFGDYNHENDMEVLRTVDYLVIDDLGGENVTAWSRDEVLSSIITYRMQNQSPIIFTSEYSKGDLFKLYSLKQKDPRDKIKVERLINNIFILSLSLTSKMVK